MPFTSQNAAKLKRFLLDELVSFGYLFADKDSQVTKIHELPKEYCEDHKIIEINSDQVTFLLLDSLLTAHWEMGADVLLRWIYEDRIIDGSELFEKIFLDEESAKKYGHSRWYVDKRNALLEAREQERAKNSRIESAEKYAHPPTPDKGNFILFSMVLDFAELQSLLETFPQFGDERKDPSTKESYQLGRSCTVAWSGVRGSNVSILPWQELQIGVVIDPDKIDAPYGDMFAFCSYDIIPDESELEGIKSDYTGYVSKVKTNSKYEGKVIVERRSNLPRKEITNQARIIKHEDGHQILAEGSIEAFAGNVWRKYFKYGSNSTNEVLCTQKIDAGNPIVGIFLDITHGVYTDHSRPQEALLKSTYPHLGRDPDRIEMLEILRRHPSLDLYSYDRNLEEHVVRVIENKEALQVLARKKEIGGGLLESLKPFSGIEVVRNTKSGSIFGRVQKISLLKDQSGGKSIA